MEKNTKNVIKHVLEGAFIVVILAVIVCIYLAIAGQVADIFEMSKTNDYDAVKEYLQSFGWEGGLLIALLEMLQMIVVIIPAEFVQIAAGLAYPIYFAIPICVAGICAGATVIFLIVRILHLRLSIMERRQGKIQKFISKINSSASMTAIMYLLFVMPIVPFGAICYFAASSNISYKRYIGVVATGVLPSVTSSFVLGNIVYRCIGLSGPTFILVIVLAIIAVLTFLFLLIWLVKRLFFPKKIKKPNPIFYGIIKFFVTIFMGSKFKTDYSGCEKIEEKSYVSIGTHTSVLDFYFTAKANKKNRINMVCNRYYTQLKSTRGLVSLLQVIPKSLFAPDIETIKGVLEAKKAGCVIDIRPEGRLSTDGSCFPPAPGTASLIKKLGLSVYFNSTVGGYFARPKWRSNFAKNNVKVTMKRLLTAEQVQQMSVLEIEDFLATLFNYDECEEYKKVTPKKNSVDVRGLEGVIYRCPKCHSEGVFESTKTTLTCSHCGNTLTFNDNYLADGKTISQLFSEQKQALGNPLDFSDRQNCKVKRMDLKKGKMIDCGQGECELKDGRITFNGTIDGEQKTFSHDTDSLYALAFSVNEEFEFYYDKVLYYFYPEDKLAPIKWSTVWDLLQERKEDGKKQENN